MKLSYVLAFALSVVAVPAMAQPAAESATSAPAVSKGATIFSADGRRIGRVDRVRETAISLIYNGKFIDIPLSTLTTASKGYATSLTKAELGKL